MDSTTDQGIPEAARELIAQARGSERETRRDHARSLYEAALRAVDQSEHPTLASAIMRWIGRTHYQGRNLDAAMDCFEAALAVAQAHGDVLGQAKAVNGKGIVEQMRGNLKAAADHYIWSLERALKVEDERLAAMIHQNLGVISNIEGDFAEALRQYRLSKEAYDALGEDDWIGPILNNIGRLHSDLGEWADAETALLEAEQRCERSGDIDHQVLSHVNLARMWIIKLDFERARESCDRACSLSRDVSGGRWTGEILKHYGAIYQSTGRLELALDSLAHAREVAEGEGDTLLAAETAREFAEVYAKQGRNQDTLKALNESFQLFSDFNAKHNLAEVRDRVIRLESRFLDVVRAWGESIESKDRYTQGHCERVAAYACALATASGMDAVHLRWFRMGALLHDVGKIVVPSSILNKRGPLTAEEWVTMKLHPQAGVHLLREIEFPWDIRPMVRHHHEHWDGGGYPDGLSGDDIPLSARILCLADVFDALTSNRSYRAGLASAEALSIMAEDCGRIFDPALFEIFSGLHSPNTRGWNRSSPRNRGIHSPNPHYRYPAAWSVNNSA
jgi:putative nucleotidyltransferase with HDIG domain